MVEREQGEQRDVAGERPEEVEAQRLARHLASEATVEEDTGRERGDEAERADIANSRAARIVALCRRRAYYKDCSVLPH